MSHVHIVMSNYFNGCDCFERVISVFSEQIDAELFALEQNEAANAQGTEELSYFVVSHVVQ